VVENSRKDYILHSLAHGIPRRVVVFKYLLKPSIIPLVSLTGMSFAMALSSLFIVESIFVWPGFAYYGMQSFLNKDLNAIVGVIMMIGLTYAISNMVVDYVVGWLDPRTRIMRRSK
jgi:peptide/nickel transport system permease protein